MALFGIRTALKSGLKRALGRPDDPPAQQQWATQTAPTPPAAPQQAAPAPEPEPPVEVAPDEDAAQTAPAEADAPAQDAAPVEEAPAPSGMAADDDTAGPPIQFEAVQEILDDMVRPALQGDGGDITLLKVEGNDIHVKLVGACSTCPSSIMTMKMGVEALLREEFPAMNELVQHDA